MQIIITGVGSGNNLNLTYEARNAIIKAKCILSAKRHESLIPPGKKIIRLENLNEAVNLISNESEILILVSGDPGVFSLMPFIKNHFPEAEIKILPGISSLQILCAKVFETWNDALILSGHGRELERGIFLNNVLRNNKIILFCDDKNSPDVICKWFSENNFNLNITIGENLGLPDEKIYNGQPEDFVNNKFKLLCVILIKNPETVKDNKYICDKDFTRLENIPITNEITRAVILSRLQVYEKKIFWDIGCGTGSISVCAGLENINLGVHSIDINPDATNLTEINAKKFKLHNINIHTGNILNLMSGLPKPDLIFIGGSDGDLKNILDEILKLENNFKLVISCITPENFNVAFEILSKLKNFECVQIQANIYNGIFMKANNPAIILSAEKF